jgi:protein arginine N-methyltransferase 1
MNYDLRSYLRMVEDQARYDAYAAALRGAIRPGDVVLDLGAGTGVMSFLALEAGAGHVFAVDTNPLIECVRLVAKASGLTERLTILTGDARRLPIPPVDVIVHDLRGAMPLFRDGVLVLDDVRSRLLKPGGRLVALRDEIYLAPVSSPSAYAAISGWQRPYGGVDFSPVGRLAASVPFKHLVSRDELLAVGQHVATLDYARGGIPALVVRAEARALRAGTLDGLCGWFRSILTEEITLSTEPDAGSTLYGQTYFPLYERQPVSAGERIEMTLAARIEGDGVVWSWSAALHRDGQPVVRESRSTLDLLGMSSMRRPSSARPQVGPEGEIDRLILEHADGNVSVGEIAAALARRFPTRFPSSSDAVARVQQIVGRYSSDP